jgi:hypothetical protein
VLSIFCWQLTLLNQYFWKSEFWLEKDRSGTFHFICPSAGKLSLVFVRSESLSEITECRMNSLGVELTSIDTCNRCYCESHGAMKHIPNFCSIWSLGGPFGLWHFAAAWEKGEERFAWDWMVSWGDGEYRKIWSRQVIRKRASGMTVKLLHSSW